MLLRADFGDRIDQLGAGRRQIGLGWSDPAGFRSACPAPAPCRKKLRARGRSGSGWQGRGGRLPKKFRLAPLPEIGRRPLAEAVSPSRTVGAGLCQRSRHCRRRSRRPKTIERARFAPVPAAERPRCWSLRCSEAGARRSLQRFWPPSPRGGGCPTGRPDPWPGAAAVDDGEGGKALSWIVPECQLAVGEGNGRPRAVARRPSGLGDRCVDVQAAVRGRAGRIRTVSAEMPVALRGAASIRRPSRFGRRRPGCCAGTRVCAHCRRWLPPSPKIGAHPDWRWGTQAGKARQCRRGQGRMASGDRAGPLPRDRPADRSRNEPRSSVISSPMTKQAGGFSDRFRCDLASARGRASVENDAVAAGFRWASRTAAWR